MAQWVNRLRNNIFVNPPPLPLLCEISGALHLAQPGLTAGRQAVHPSVCPADEIQVNFEFSKLAVGRNIRLVASLTKVQHHFSLTNAFQPVFSGKAYCKVDC